jgi:uncharacterized RDD family membrane protein YckC
VAGPLHTPEESFVNEFEKLYSPPQSTISANGVRSVDLEDASTNRRFANLVVDSFARTGFAFVLGVALAIAHIEVDSLLSKLLFGLMSIFLYYVLFEWLFGCTLGKLITGTRVVRADGERPTLGAIVIRTLSRLVPFEPFSFLSGERQGWHDRWSETRVVRVRR